MTLVRHADLSFLDGNLVVLADSHYFVVHRGILIRHSPVLRDLLNSPNPDPDPAIDGRPVLRLSESSCSIAHLLQALYDGISFISYDQTGFPTVASLLRVLTTYKVHRIRNDILSALYASWPQSLVQWESREISLITANGAYTPRPTLPHPVEVIKLARDIDAPLLLPSAMYDLSRYAPSEAATGIFDIQLGDYVRLDETDLLYVLRGREHAARYFSTFIVTKIEGRPPAAWCLRRNDPNPSVKRVCQIAFEAITFELLRDINGIASHPTSDPLYAMSSADAMQARESFPDDGPSTTRTCEICRAEFSSVVLAARDDFWNNLPLWFGVDVPMWG